MCASAAEFIVPEAIFCWPILVDSRPFVAVPSSSLRPAALRAAPAIEADEGEKAEPTVAELAEAAQNGQPGAMEAVFVRFERTTFALLLRLLGDYQEAEDALQDTFVEAVETIGQLRCPAALGGWIRQIAVFRALKRFRRRRLSRALGLYTPVPNATLEALAAESIDPERRAELALVDRRLSLLPPVDRLVWSLRFVEGLTLPEIAEATRTSVSTAKRRVARARAKMRLPPLDEVTP